MLDLRCTRAWLLGLLCFLGQPLPDHQHHCRSGMFRDRRAACTHSFGHALSYLMQPAADAQQGSSLKSRRAAERMHEELFMWLLWLLWWLLFMCVLSCLPCARSNGMCCSVASSSFVGSALARPCESLLSPVGRGLSPGRLRQLDG
jgi:hypothetical protein